MAASVGVHPSSPDLTAGQRDFVKRVVRLAVHAFDVSMALITVGDDAAPVVVENSASHLTDDRIRALRRQLAATADDATVQEAVELEHPSLAEETEIGFLAAAPIHDVCKRRVGTLCIADLQPRSFTAAEGEHLGTLAALAGTRLTSLGHLISSRLLQRVVQRTDRGIVVTDADGQITWVNEGFTRLCGYTRDALRGRKRQDVLQGLETDPSVVETMREHMCARESFTAEVINYRKSGEPYWAHIQAEPILSEEGRLMGFVALETDVSDRKAVEATLRSERNLFATAIDTVDALIVILDSEGRVVYFNEACRHVTGYDRREVIGEQVVDLLVPEDEQSKVETIIEAHRTGQQRSTFECHWLTKDGKRRLIDWSNTALKGGDGDIRFLIGTGIDITKQRQMEHRLLQVSEEERRRIGQDLHDILASHLAGTTMMAKGLEQKVDRGQDVTADDLHAIVRQVQKAAHQTRILSHSLMPVRMEDQDLGDALRHLIENKQELTDIECTVDVGAEVPPIEKTVAMHLYRIAYEAMNNAVKHADPDHVRVRFTQDGDHLMLTVCDDGVGISDECTQADGLGLHMMRYRADVIGADLHVQPSEGGGTIVRCRLPVEKAKSSS